MTIYRLGQKIKELYIHGQSIAKVYDHGQLVFSKNEEATNFTLSINPSPSNATVRLTYNGTTITSKTITVPAGSTVSYSVSATGYTTQSDTVLVNANKNIRVTLVKDTSSAKWWCYKGTVNLFDASCVMYVYATPDATSGPIYCRPVSSAHDDYVIPLELIAYGCKVATKSSQLKWISSVMYEYANINTTAIKIASKTSSTLRADKEFSSTVFTRYTAGDIY